MAVKMETSRKRVLAILAPGFEETEALAPSDVISRSGIEISLAHLPSEPSLVRGSHGFVLQSSCSLSDIDLSLIDAILLPGGMPGTRLLCQSPDTLRIVKTLSCDGRLVGAICAAPLVLKTAGILTRESRITSHPSVRQELGEIQYCELPVVVHGRTITSRGPGTALLFGLTMVAALKGIETANHLAGQMIIDLPESVLNEWRHLVRVEPYRDSGQ